MLSTRYFILLFVTGTGVKAPEDDDSSGTALLDSTRDTTSEAMVMSSADLTTSESVTTSDRSVMTSESANSVNDQATTSEDTTSSDIVTVTSDGFVSSASVATPSERGTTGDTTFTASEAVTSSNTSLTTSDGGSTSSEIPSTSESANYPSAITETATIISETLATTDRTLNTNSTAPANLNSSVMTSDGAGFSSTARSTSTYDTTSGTSIMSSEDSMSSGVTLTTSESAMASDTSGVHVVTSEDTTSSDIVTVTSDGFVSSANVVTPSERGTTGDTTFTSDGGRTSSEIPLNATSRSAITESSETSAITSETFATTERDWTLNTNCTAPGSVMTSESVSSDISTVTSASGAADAASSESVTRTTGTASTADSNTTPMTSTSTSTTSTSSTTTSSTTTPGSVTLPTGFYPPNIDGKAYRIVMAVAFQRPFDTSLNDSSTENYQLLSLEVMSVVTSTVHKADAGDGFLRATLHNFSPEEGYMEYLKNVSEHRMFILATNNHTVANYTLEYAMSHLTDNEIVDDLFDSLIGPFTNLLTNETIDSWAINGEFLENYTDYLNTTEIKKIKRFVSNPCLSGEQLCDVCQDCSLIDSIGSPGCEERCKQAEHRVCVLDIYDEAYDCVCQANYLPVAGSCVSDNVILGTSCAIGVALVLGLVVLIIIIFRQRHERGGLMDDRDEEFSFDRAEINNVDYEITVNGVQEDLFPDFQSNLSHIDPSVKYVIARPRLIHSSESPNQSVNEGYEIID